MPTWLRRLFDDEPNVIHKPNPGTEIIFAVLGTTDVWVIHSISTSKDVFGADRIDMNLVHRDAFFAKNRTE